VDIPAWLTEEAIELAEAFVSVRARPWSCIRFYRSLLQPTYSANCCSTSLKPIVPVGNLVVEVDNGVGLVGLLGYALPPGRIPRARRMPLRLSMSSDLLDRWY
jgi:hypothetical protein